MLIEVDSSLLDGLRDDLDSSYRTAAETIARARWEGKHVVYSDRDTLDGLSDVEGLSRRTRATFSRIKSRLSSLNSLFQYVRIRLKVVAGADQIVLDSDSLGEYIEAPAGHFTDTSSIQPTTLLTEDLSDCDLYKVVASVAGHTADFGTIPLDYIDRHGGGGATVGQYSRIQYNAERLCLCVLDSDRKCPNGSIGSTAEDVADVDDNDQPLTQYRTTQGREIENLIPCRAYELVAQPRSDRLNTARALRQIQNTAHPESRHYLDVKDSTLLHELLNYSSGTREDDYWAAVIPDVAANGHYHLNICVEDRQCREVDEDDCRCVVIPGVGPNAVDDVTVALRERSTKKVAEFVEPVLEPEWERLGGEILSWCCSSHRMAGP